MESYNIILFVSIVGVGIGLHLLIRNLAVYRARMRVLKEIEISGCYEALQNFDKGLTYEQMLFSLTNMDRLEDTLLKQSFKGIKKKSK